MGNGKGSFGHLVARWYDRRETRSMLLVCEVGIRLAQTQSSLVTGEG